MEWDIGARSQLQWKTFFLSETFDWLRSGNTWRAELDVSELTGQEVKGIEMVDANLEITPGSDGTMLHVWSPSTSTTVVPSAGGQEPTLNAPMAAEAPNARLQRPIAECCQFSCQKTIKLYFSFDLDQYNRQDGFYLEDSAQKPRILLRLYTSKIQFTNHF